MERPVSEIDTVVHMPTKKITIHVLDLAQNQEVVVEVERETEEEIAII